MKTHWLAAGVLGGAALFLPACAGNIGNSSDTDNDPMDLQQVSNGTGQLLPHTVRELGANGQPTTTVIPVRSLDDLLNNVTATNRILPVPQFPTDPNLPSGAPGNHFLYAEFTKDIDITSVLTDAPTSQNDGGLTGAITLIALDPSTGNTEVVPARVFIGVKDGDDLFAATYAGTATGSPPALPLQRWVRLNPDTGSFEVQTVDGATPGFGFPGTDGTFTGFEKLISTRTLVFVADSDSDLSTYERFPIGRQLKMRISTAVRATNGRFQERQCLASSTVGTDILNPEVATTPPPINSPLITPGGGEQDVDPQTTITVEFTEPVQPLTVGSLPTGQAPAASAAVLVQFGPPAARVTVPFTAAPLSVFDLSKYELVTLFNFPGEGPETFECGVFDTVDITVNPQQIRDLAIVPNINLVGAATFFNTGEGPGLINAPVTPDAVYVGRSGAVPNLSVIDLNGFGQSTGNPEFDPTYQTFEEGRSNFPNNPNVRLQGSLLRPPLAVGNCTIDGGSAGVFTLTRDSSLDDRLLRAPLIADVSDIMVGHSLDGAFNNGPQPFGCQVAGGNLCAVDGKKLITPVILATGNTMGPSLPGQFGGLGAGAENLVGWGPHPNPPPLLFPPLCASPYIGGQEPTSVNTINAPPVGPGLTNLLAPGDPFGDPLNGVPPSGLLASEQNAWFEGPTNNASTIQGCLDFQMRQQVGQFLYLIDRARREIVVLNSNRMTVIDRVTTFDPTTLAMSPNLNFLAVVNQLTDLVSFIDIEPNSSTFHQVVAETVVGDGPRGIAWEPGNEDIHVVNEGDNTLSVLSASSLAVRKIISSQLNQPFDVAMTPRMFCWEFNRNVYFSYILNRNGKVAIFESGPNTINGWGYDDIVGISTETFQNPKAIQPDHIDKRSAVWIAHEGVIDPLDGTPGPVGTPAVSKFVLLSALQGIVQLTNNNQLTPQIRDMEYGVQVSIGQNQLSGLPVDLAFDNLLMLSGMANFTTSFSAGPPQPYNGKQLVRGGCPMQQTNGNSNEPNYMFVAVPNPIGGTGVVDVILIDGTYGRVDTNKFQPGIQSIPAPGVQVLSDFFRQ